MWGTISVFARRDWGRQQDTSVRVANIPAEILTEHFPKTATLTCSAQRGLSTLTYKMHNVLGTG
jgi:hypothetical protein